MINRLEYELKECQEKLDTERIEQKKLSEELNKQYLIIISDIKERFKGKELEY